MIISYIGNFGPDHSTENHVRQAWLDLGHSVHLVQEDRPADWEALIADVTKYDLILWTSTGGMAESIGRERQLRMLTAARKAGVRTVGFHLDRWWGLDREAQVSERPFFRCDLVITADGGHDDRFAAVGVNHLWMPPAISKFEAEPGTVRHELRSNLAFVGSWRPGYHREWTHRPELINWLAVNYRDQIRLYPEVGKPTIRGEGLRDIYASTDIVIGDSCLSAPVGFATHYWSDRIPETIGRQGFLLHPHVKGIEDHFEVGKHLDTWPVADWKKLKTKIEYYMNNLEEARTIAAAGRLHVLEHHTYHTRVNQIIEAAS